jgi:hypothetical protein
MLDIIIIVVVSMKIAAMQKEKGRGAAGYVVLFIMLCLGGEVFGAIAGVILALILDANALDNDNSPFLLCAAGLALVGLLVGGTTGFMIAKLTPPLEDPRLRRFDNFDDDDDDDYRERRPRRRRYADEGDYKERPRRGRETDDGEFEEPRRR